MPLPWKPTPAIHATLAIHAGAAVGCLIEPAIWPWALGALVANHALITTAGLLPRSTLLGPNLTRLPPAAIAHREVAITIDDGPDPEVTPQVLDLLDADRAQQRHKNALVAENLLPDNGNRDRAADDGRDVVQNAVDRHTLVLFVQKRCHKQGKRQTQRHNHENIAEGDDHCLLEVFVVGENRDVVFQPHKVRGGQQVIVCQGVVDGHSSRDQPHKEEAEQPRCQQKIAGHVVLHLIVLLGRCCGFQCGHG